MPHVTAWGPHSQSRTLRVAAATCVSHFRIRVPAAAVDARDVSAMTLHTYCEQCVAVLANGVATTGHTLKRFQKRASLVVGPRGPGRWAVLALSSGICTVVEKPRIATSRTDTRECEPGLTATAARFSNARVSPIPVLAPPIDVC